MYYTLKAKIFLNVTPQEMWDYAIASDQDFKTFTGFAFIPAIVGVKHKKGDGYTAGSINIIETADGGRLEETTVESDAPHYIKYEVKHYHYPFRLVVQSAQGEFHYKKSGKGMIEEWTYRYKLASPLSYPLAVIILGIFFRRAMHIKLNNQKHVVEK